MERFITSGIEFITQMPAQTLSKNIKQASQSNFPVFHSDKCRATDKSQLLDDIILTMVSLDIECSMAGELYSIGLQSHKMSDGKPIKCILMIGDQNKPSAKANNSKLNAKEAAEITEHIVWLENEIGIIIIIFNDILMRKKFKCYSHQNSIYIN